MRGGTPAIWCPPGLVTGPEPPVMLGIEHHRAEPRTSAPPGERASAEATPRASHRRRRSLRDNERGAEPRAGDGIELDSKPPRPPSDSNIAQSGGTSSGARFAPGRSGREARRGRGVGIVRTTRATVRRARTRGAMDTPAAIDTRRARGDGNRDPESTVAMPEATASTTMSAVWTRRDVFAVRDAASLRGMRTLGDRSSREVFLGTNARGSLASGERHVAAPRTHRRCFDRCHQQEGYGSAGLAAYPCDPHVLSVRAMSVLMVAFIRLRP